jgi:glutamate-1-semialdehyde aminotransferase
MNDREYLKHWTPGGSQTRSKRDLFDEPHTTVVACGSKVYSADDRAYIDWIAALASVGLGYNHGVVDTAVVDRIRRYGSTSPLPTRLEGEVAELLCGVLDWPQQVRWVKTGSEATNGAMLIARTATGRRKIVSLGYHGWTSGHLPGPELVTVPWGSWAFADAITHDTAGVLLEPFRDHQTVKHNGDLSEWVERIQDRCKDVGALLIMDEVVTGFRWAVGGATEYLAIEAPDLACYGKAMANGYPIAAIVGKRDLMKYASEVSSTFGGEGVGLAAAKATIEIYKSEPVINRLWEVGRRLMKGVPELEGFPVHPHFRGEGEWGSSSAVSQAAAKKGILAHPAGMNPMYCHTDADVDRTIEVFREILDA